MLPTDYQTMPLATTQARKLPTPKVTTRHVRQDVDLSPSGNTIAVRTTADNPFTRERANQVSIVTQASPGMSPAPTSMQSRRILHAWMPGMGGLGDTPQAQPSGQSTAFSALTSAAEGTLSVLSERERRKAQQAEATSDQALAKARALEAEAKRLEAETGGYLARMKANKGSRLMFGIAAVSLGLAGYLWWAKRAAQPVKRSRVASRKTTKRKTPARRR